MAKLTLSVDEAAIKKAKAYAKEVGESLSSLVEQYFKAMTAEKRSQKINQYLQDASPMLQSLRGTIKDDGTDREKEYKEHLLRKYSK